jgi:kinesin family protein 6/9
MNQELDEDENDEAAQEIIDEDELGMLTRLKELKKTYRANFTELKSIKTQVNQVQQAIDHAKQQLVTDFEEWFEENYEMF